MLSVSGVDGYDATKLQAKLTDNVSQLLKDCSVLSQNVSDADSKLVDKANKYGITVGKARLIEEIISSNSRHNFEELVGLTINELNLIADGQQLPGISTQGQASDKSYIGNDAALSAALTHAGLSSNDVREVEVDLDYEYGMMVYEVEFECGSVEYEYGIAATDGSVIWVEDDEGYRVRSGRPDYMYANTAKRAALSHAGLTEDQVSLLRTELDHDDGIHVYEVKFKYGDYEYEYKVDGGSGTVIDFEKELHH